MAKSIPTILAIETATSACSVSLCLGSDRFSERQIGKNVHSQVLLPMVDSVLREARIDRTRLDAVAVGQGPGSFTGLRIGIGVAQGLAYGAGAPMIGVSSLTALAQQAVWHHPDAEEVFAAIDARMDEVYFARFERNPEGVTQKGSIQLAAPENIPPQDMSKGTVLAGNAWQEYRGRFAFSWDETKSPQESCLLPDATAVLELALEDYRHQRWVEPQYFEPDYVRNEVAKVKGAP